MNFKFPNIIQARAEITRLETLLGVPEAMRSKSLNHITEANSRIFLLEEMADRDRARASAPAAAPITAAPGREVTIKAATAILQAPLTATEKWHAIEDPRARTAFYRAHKEEISADFAKGVNVETLRPKSATPAASGILAQYNAIKDPADRVAFYRANKQAIDLAYCKLNQ